jgi:hypothetical protein
LKKNIVYVNPDQFEQLDQLGQKYNLRTISQGEFVEMATMVCPELRVGEENHLVRISGSLQVPSWPKKEGS